MHILAIHRLRGNEELLARELAFVLATSVVEARSRIHAPCGGPSVIARFAEPAAAAASAASLRARGFDVLELTERDLESDAGRFLVRGFAFGEASLRVESRSESLEIAYSDVELLLCGAYITDRVEAPPAARRKLSLGRMVLTGGLVVSKPVREARRARVTEREGFLHLYAGRPPVVVFREAAVLYRSLGGDLAPSRAANFARLVAELRRRCPQAIYDARLAKHGGQAQLLGPTLPPQGHLDVAISVLARALLPVRA
ncbi:MAG TPA: hypothetical protein VHQ90_21490 [Thermoanaerobaculia bacterium]|nr:hypothetical protein [Thermoanaerobaculia bacterium]